MARTFSAGCTKAWQPIIDGASYASFGIQLAGQATVLIATSTAQPDEATKDYMALYMGSTRELTLELDANEKLYIKGLKVLEVAVRGYRKARV